MEIKNTDWSLTFAIILMLLGIFSIFFPYDIINNFQFLKYKIIIGKYSELGDFINGVSTPFISVAVFILLYRTYMLQKKELLDTKILLAEQNETLTIQQFETTLFNLITLHNQIINNIDFNSSLDEEMYDKETDGEPIILKGRDCIRQFYFIFTSKYRNWESDEKKTPAERNTYNAVLEKELILMAYGSFYSEHETDIGHYFRNIENIVKLIDRSKIKEKDHYIDIITAQLSTYEILLLFYSCLSTNESNLLEFVIKYKLLRNIDHQSLIHMNHITLIDKNAYN